MDPIIAGTLAGVGIQVLGGLVGEAISKGDRDTALALLRKAAAESDIPLPELEKLAAETLGPSAMEDISVNPEFEAAQMEALDSLGRIADEGGMLLADEANLNKIQSKVNRDAAARNNAVREDMATRGVGGSGAEFAIATANNQAATQTAADTGLDIAAQAQMRALDAIMQRGELAGDVRGQDFDEQARVAEAKDLISRYNAGAKERTNTYNAGLAQQQFDNRRAAGRDKATAATNMASYYSGEASRKANMAGGTANAAAYGTYGVADHAQRQKDKEKDDEGGGTL